MIVSWWRIGIIYIVTNIIVYARLLCSWILLWCLERWINVSMLACLLNIVNISSTFLSTSIFTYLISDLTDGVILFCTRLLFASSLSVNVVADMSVISVTCEDSEVFVVWFSLSLPLFFFTWWFGVVSVVKLFGLFFCYGRTSHYFVVFFLVAFWYVRVRNKFLIALFVEDTSR